LPIPALDGGRALWMVLQSIFKIKPEKYFKYEWYVNMFFFYLILLLWVVIIVKDLVVFRWVNIPFVS
jgi:membrane-associated protease RseP (regulator of RpoE activity)